MKKKFVRSFFFCFYLFIFLPIFKFCLFFKIVFRHFLHIFSCSFFLYLFIYLSFTFFFITSFFHSLIYYFSFFLLLLCITPSSFSQLPSISLFDKRYWCLYDGRKPISIIFYSHLITSFSINRKKFTHKRKYKYLCSQIGTQSSLSVYPCNQMRIYWPIFISSLHASKNCVTGHYTLECSEGRIILSRIQIMTVWILLPTARKAFFY